MNELTVVITTYNRPTTLHMALESVSSAFGKGTNCIIGDNGNHDITSKLLEDNYYYDLKIIHIKNASGGNFMTNLDSVVREVITPWMTLLHDDDFFMENCGEVISKYLSNDQCDFIFSDHWIASNEGSILKNETDNNTKHYKRNKLIAGPVSNIIELVINEVVCLDGFFVRTSLIEGVQMEFTRVSSDIRWIIELCEKSKYAFFIKDRLFAYRLSHSGLTANGAINVKSLLESLIDTLPNIEKEASIKALKIKINSVFWGAVKHAIKKVSLLDFFYIIKKRASIYNKNNAPNIHGK